MGPGLIEFGWFYQGANSLRFSLDIPKTPSGYLMFWTMILDNVSPVLLRQPATITLTSGAFEACTAISKEKDNFPGDSSEDVIGSLQDDHIVLNTPALLNSDARSIYTATWLIDCPHRVSLTGGGSTDGMPT